MAWHGEIQDGVYRDGGADGATQGGQAEQGESERAAGGEARHRDAGAVDGDARVSQHGQDELLQIEDGGWERVVGGLGVVQGNNENVVGISEAMIPVIIVLGRAEEKAAPMDGE